MNNPEDKKTPSKTDVPNQSVNPARLIKAPKPSTKSEFSLGDLKKEYYNNKK